MIPSGSHVFIVAYSINMKSLRDSIERGRLVILFIPHPPVGISPRRGELKIKGCINMQQSFPSS